MIQILKKCAYKGTSYIFLNDDFVTLSFFLRLLIMDEPSLKEILFFLYSII